MALPKDTIILPRACRSKKAKNEFEGEYIKINPYCLLHKTYPRCSCGRKFIKECLWCKYKK